MGGRGKERVKENGENRERDRRWREGGGED